MQRMTMEGISFTRIIMAINCKCISKHPSRHYITGIVFYGHVFVKSISIPIYTHTHIPLTSIHFILISPLKLQVLDMKNVVLDTIYGM